MFVNYKALHSVSLEVVTSGLDVWELYYWDNGKENGNYYRILRVYSDNGKENGSCYIIIITIIIVIITLHPKLHIQPKGKTAPDVLRLGAFDLRFVLGLAGSVE